MNRYIINTGDLKNNINFIKSRSDVPVCAVLKCDGYGLGLIPFAKLLYDEGIRIFAVSETDEAVKLRESFDCEILMLTSVSTKEDAYKLAAADIIATVGSLSAAKALDEAGRSLNKTPRAHIEINTGMGRCGFSQGSISDILSLKDLSIDFCGTFTHFSFSFSDKKEDVLNPLKSFMACVDKLNKNGFKTGVLHAANSAAFLDYPETQLDMVRAGSAFLGRTLAKNKSGLKKIGHLESVVLETNFLKKGENVGYGNTYSVKRDTETAIIPLGYSHGFLVEKKNDSFRFSDILRYIYHDLKPKKYSVKINGKNVPIIGRVGMYNIICDITGLGIKAGDMVIADANPIYTSASVERKYV